MAKTIFDRAVDAFIEHIIKNAVKEGGVAPYAHHIIAVRVNDHYIPISVHVRWTRGHLNVIAHTIVQDELTRDLLRNLNEADRRMGGIIPRDKRGRLAVIWGKGGVEAVKTAIYAKWATDRQEYHLEYVDTSVPKGRAILAAIYNLSLRGKETPVKIHARKEMGGKVALWLFTPEARIHTHDGEMLHWGTAPDPRLLRPHPEAVVITRRVSARNIRDAIRRVQLY